MILARMRRQSGALFFALLCATGCQNNTGTATRDGDALLFVNEVQPVLAMHCAFEGCHGQEGMPLTLYALDYQRQRDPDGLVNPNRPTLDERALSAEEIEHNRLAFAARIGAQNPAGDVDRFVRRLIPPRRGGIPHADVVVFDNPDDPQLDAIRRFLQSVR